MSDTTRWDDRLDTHARAALQSAYDESARAGLGYVGTEQLLLGLIAQPRGAVRRTLRAFGLELDSARSAFERVRPLSAEHVAAVPGSELTLTPEAKRAIEHALRTANQNAVRTEHLLVGVLELGSGSALDLLHLRGVNIAALVARVRTPTRTGVPPSRQPRLGSFDPVEHGYLPTVAPGAARNNVVMCRLDDTTLEAIDALIEAGVRPSRSDAAAWLISAGLTSKAAVLDAVRDKVTEIRNLRDAARALAEDADTPAP